MKKILSGIICVLLLSSCFGKEIEEKGKTEEEIKRELLEGKTTKNNTNNEQKYNNSGSEEKESEITNSGTTEENEDLGKINSEENSMNIKYLTEEKFLEFDDFILEDFKSFEKEITGKTLTDIDKIVVSFSNPNSDFEDYDYTLKKFKAGDSTFLYRAFKKYESIDYGENTYIFTAHKGDKISKLELKINLEKEKLKPINFDNLPEDGTFGSPVKLGNGNITYTDIKGLEISNVGNIDLKMENDSITKYLGKTLNSWFYWNNLRYIKDKSGVSFYVVSKDSESNTYSYSKHYYNFNGIYGILELETGKMEDGIELKELNTKLAEKNDDFTITAISDALFKKLTN